jgi:hypothetical protein
MTSYIVIGRESQISMYVHRRSIAFYILILMKSTTVREHCMEKSYAEFDWNWARNAEKMGKYLLTQMSDVQFFIKRFWSTSHEFKTTVWRNHTPSDWNRARYIGNTSKYIYIYTHTHTSKTQQSMPPLRWKQQLKSPVWTNYIPSLIEKKRKMYKTPAI